MDEKTLARFWKKVDKNGPVPAHCPELGPCWVWIGKRNDNGYGIFTIGKMCLRSHRISWELSEGPTSLHVLHKCDNPACLNPSHLFAGTQQDNVEDMWSKARAVPPPAHLGAANNRARLTAEQVIEIRRLYAGGATQTELGARFGMRQNKISDIVLCRVWKHLPGAEAQRREPAERANAKLSADDVRRMRALRRSGIGNRAIAAQFGISENAARNAISGKTWSHVVNDSSH